VKGVFWRQLLRWGVLNVPFFIEPLAMAIWSLFFLLWGPGRRGVMRNLSAILPGSTAAGNFFRTYRVFWNYAWTIADNVRFLERQTVPDWDFVDNHYFEQMEAHAGGAIILTAHMGSYDLGAHLFAQRSRRNIVMVRAPETDPQTRAYEEAVVEARQAESLSLQNAASSAAQEKLSSGLRIGFNNRASDLAFDLLASVQNGDIIAIQGDRVTQGIAGSEARLFHRRIMIPSGPFALAMAARVPIFPIFVMRHGRRRYRLVTCKPIMVERRTRNRDEAIDTAIAAWTAQLELVLREGWYQWFTFEPYSEELA
jgi:predicted LPLAT superfamily acyltransferase